MAEMSGGQHDALDAARADQRQVVAGARAVTSDCFDERRAVDGRHEFARRLEQRDDSLNGRYRGGVVLLGGGASSPDRASAPASVVVPAEAVVDVRGVPTVFVAGERPGVFLPQSVRVGPAAGASILVEAGLADGASIVIAGGVLLKGELLRSALEGG